MPGCLHRPTLLAFLIGILNWGVMPGLQGSPLVPDVQAQSGSPTLEQPVVAVLPFIDAQAGPESRPHRWLSLALTDLTINHLSTTENLRVVSRQRIDSAISRGDLRMPELIPQAGSPDTAEGFVQGGLGRRRLRLRKLSLDAAVFGVYRIQGDQLTLWASLVRTDGSVAGQLRQRGPLSDALTLQRRLAVGLLRAMDDPRSLEMLRRELPRWTDSLPAAQRHYEGVELAERGQYARAWLSFRRALRADPGYPDAAYGVARMYYYRQMYDHARLAYERFFREHPEHPRRGDAVIEYVHSFEQVEPDAESALTLYERLAEASWGLTRVHNQDDFLHAIPLTYWLAQRQAQPLIHLGRFRHAFNRLVWCLGQHSLANDFEKHFYPHFRDSTRWLAQRMAIVAEERLTERFEHLQAPYADHTFNPEQPILAKTITDKEFRGGRFKNGYRRRFLAPPGYFIDKLTWVIQRRNDPKIDSVAALKIRRHRYIDIQAAQTDNDSGEPIDGDPHHRRATGTIDMPAGCTWFLCSWRHYLKRRIPRRQKHSARFERWQLRAHLKPIPKEGGSIWIEPTNAARFSVAVDGVYTRTFAGAIPHLPPGKYRLNIKPAIYDPARVERWGLRPMEVQAEVRAGEVTRLSPRLTIRPRHRAEGWSEAPETVVREYPFFRHRPRRPLFEGSGGEPASAVDARGRRLVVWSHRDELWLNVSPDGRNWSEPICLPTPVNSAHAEIKPKLIVDEAGRCVLMFLSDRGIERTPSPYICWSEDLRHWSRPVRLAKAIDRDYDLLQARDGRYLVLLGGSHRQEYFNTAQNHRWPHDWGNQRPPRLLVSRDLLQWRQIALPRRIPWMNALDLEQDARGRFHLVGLQPWMPKGHGVIHYDERQPASLFYFRSPDLEQWSRREPIPPSLCHDANTLSAAVVGDRLLMGVGEVDYALSNRETFYMLCRLLGPSGERFPARSEDAPAVGAWRRVAIPGDVIEYPMALSLEPGSRSVSVTWATRDQALDPIRPSGPIYRLVLDASRMGLRTTARPARSQGEPPRRPAIESDL